MTNEEVIRIAQGLITDFKCDSEMMVDFCNTVIKKFEQQTSDDCVSRNTLKRAVSELTYWHPTADGRLEVGGAFNNTVYKVEDVWRLTRELPSVTPQQTRWIPVTERLPEAYEFVNCTCHSLIDDREDWVIETVYIPRPSDSPYSDWGNIPMLNSGDCKVVAWMHRDIPEPYKAESEE